jgi:hypothetical protein
MQTSFLITDTSKSIHKRNTRMTNKYLSPKRLKCIMKSGQEAVGMSKLKRGLLTLTRLTSIR